MQTSWIKSRVVCRLLSVFSLISTIIAIGKYCANSALVFCFWFYFSNCANASSNFVASSLDSFASTCYIKNRFRNDSSWINTQQQHAWRLVCDADDRGEHIKIYRLCEVDGLSSRISSVSYNIEYKLSDLIVNNFEPRYINIVCKLILTQNPT